MVSTMSTIKLVKLIGDFFHIFSYLPLFVVLRLPQSPPQGISVNSQELFCLALITRYLGIFLDHKELLNTVRFFADSQAYDLDTLVGMYSRVSSNAHYVFLVKAIPVVFSVAAVIKMRLFGTHRDPRDTMGSSLLYLPCCLAAVLLHQTVFKHSYKSSDPKSILKTASFLIEAVAIVPQLYMQYAPPGHRRGEGGEGRYSYALDVHMMSRAMFRACYVWCFLYKVLQRGKGLEGSYADNLQHLAGVLQMLVTSDMIAAFLRRRLTTTVAFTGLAFSLWMQGGAALAVRVCVGGMFLSTAASLVVGGFLCLNAGLLFCIVQLNRAGVLHLRSPFQFAKEL